MAMKVPTKIEIRVCVSDIKSIYDTCFATDGDLLLRFCHGGSSLQIINRSQIEKPDGAQPL